MAHLYGTWLKENHDYTEVKKKIDNLHGVNYKIFQKRSDAIFYMATLFVAEYEVAFPCLRGKLHVNYSNVLAGIGRYMNDIVHYKLWHRIGTTNRAKIVAHSIKWLWLYPVVSVSISDIEYKKLSPGARKFVLDLNLCFIGLLIGYVLEGFSDRIPTPIGKFRKIFYLLQTGQYDARNATLIFEEILFGG